MSHVRVSFDCAEYTGNIDALGTLSFYSFKYFICHIWSCGTGTLLIAPKSLTYSRSYSLAYEWRVQAMHMHIFEYGLRRKIWIFCSKFS